MAAIAVAHGVDEIALGSIGLAWMKEWICGKFSDGRELDVTNLHTYLFYQTILPLVSQYSAITSIGPGDTMVIFTYTLGTQSRKLAIPVHVEASTARLSASPAFVDFGDQAIGTNSAPRQVVITNNSGYPIKLYEPRMLGFHLEAGNCTNTTLPLGGQCFITVTFGPETNGPHHENLDFPNSNCEFAIYGNGN